MKLELYEKLCKELDIPKHYECGMGEGNCLLSLGYGIGESAKYCSKPVLDTCEYRSKTSVYTEFTDKKQLDLLKFFMRQDSLIVYYIYTEKAYGIACTVLPANEQIFVKEKDFTDALLALTFKVVCFSKECTKPIISRKEIADIIEKGRQDEFC